MPDSQLIELSREECLSLLAAHHFGRVAVNVGDGAPAIRPVNYVFDERSQSVAFRTAEGSKLHGLVRTAKAAFEVDAIDPVSRTGWSVLIVGVSEEVTNSTELRRLEAIGLEHWVPSRIHWVRIRAFTVSGRRIAPATGAAPEPPE